MLKIGVNLTLTDRLRIKRKFGFEGRTRFGLQNEIKGVTENRGNYKIITVENFEQNWISRSRLIIKLRTQNKMYGTSK